MIDTSGINFELQVESHIAGCFQMQVNNALGNFDFFWGQPKRYE
jgi:hypothetical protein